MKNYKILFFLSIVIFIAGCAITPQVPLKLVQKQELEEVKIDRKSPEEIRKELIRLQNVKPKPYRVAGGDVFTFTVYDNPELSSRGEGTTVTPDGFISLSLAGPVKIGGLTINEATKYIEL